MLGSFLATIIIIQADHLYTGMLYAGLTVSTSQLCSLVCKHFSKVLVQKI